MSDETQKKLAENQLSKLEKMRPDLERLLRKRAATGPKMMELKRQNIAQSSLTVESMIQQLLEGNLDPTSPEYQKLLNTANLMVMFTMTQELEFLCDALTIREEVRIKKDGQPVRGFIRYSVTDLLSKIGLAVMAVNDEVETIAEMTNEIGKKQEAFHTTDEHGVRKLDPNKYDIEDEDDKPEVKEVDEAEGATEDEIEAEKKKVEDKKKGKK